MRSTATVDEEERDETEEPQPQVRRFGRIRVPMTEEPDEEIELPAEEPVEPPDAGVDEEEIAEIPTTPVTSRPTTSVAPVPAPKLTPTTPAESLVAMRCNWPDVYGVRGKVTGTPYEFSGGEAVWVKQSDVLALLSRKAPNLNVPLFERV